MTEVVFNKKGTRKTPIVLSREESPVYPLDVTQLAGGLTVVRRGLLPRNLNLSGEESPV